MTIPILDGIENIMEGESADKQHFLLLMHVFKSPLLYSDTQLCGIRLNLLHCRPYLGTDMGSDPYRQKSRWMNSIDCLPWQLSLIYRTKTC